MAGESEEQDSESGEQDSRQTQSFYMVEHGWAKGHIKNFAPTLHYEHWQLQRSTGKKSLDTYMSTTQMLKLISYCMALHSFICPSMQLCEGIVK